jgi:hypothetical protein
MIEILDPEKLKRYIASNDMLSRIKEHSLLPGKRIGWNYCFDYTWLSVQFDQHIESLQKNLRSLKIVDIGAGPGAVHGFLENKYNIKIAGIDMHKWENDYVDYVGDFSNNKFREEYNLNDIDIIISSSAFEHNKPLSHATLVKKCLQSLAPEGRMIVTFAVTDKAKIIKYMPSSQWNLSFKIINEIYGEEVINKNEYEIIWERWHSNNIIRREFTERYGYYDHDTPPFLSIGANIGKDNIDKQIIRKIYFGA